MDVFEIFADSAELLSKVCSSEASADSIQGLSTLLLASPTNKNALLLTLRFRFSEFL